MPGKHKSGKKKAAFWLTKTECDTLDLLAQHEGLNKTEMFQEMLRAFAQLKGIKVDLSGLEKVVNRKEKKVK